MKRYQWVLASVTVGVVLLVLAMFGTDLKYKLTDLCNHTGGDLRTCYEVIAKPFEVG